MKRCLIVLFLGWTCVAGAQQTSPAGNAKADSTITLQDLDAGLDQEYTLGRGDLIQVDVVGRPELSGKHIIGPDGRISIPFAGSLKLVDRTREQAASDIRSSLTSFYENLIVVVGVEAYTSNQVLVLGAVVKPGPISFDQPPTLVEVISRASPLATFSPTVAGKPVTIPERCAIYRGNRSVIWVELKKLVESGSPLAQLRLKRDDVVYVPSPSEHYITMFGEVLRPGLVQLEERSTLTDLIAQAGGINEEKSGRYPIIQVVQASSGNIQYVPYRDLLTAKAAPITISAGDLVYVPESKFSRFAVSLTKLSPLFSVATIATVVAR